MGMVKTYFRENRESKGDSITTTEIWKSDLELIRKFDNMCPARDTIGIILERYIQYRKIHAKELMKTKEE